MAVIDQLRRWSPSARGVLSLIVFWGQMQNYMMRSSLSLIIVAMVRDTSTNSNSTVTNITETCLENREDAAGESENSHGDLDWSMKETSQVLAIFNIGYVCTQVGAVIHRSEDEVEIEIEKI